MPSARRGAARTIQVTGAVPGAAAEPAVAPERRAGSRRPPPGRPPANQNPPAGRRSDLMSRVLVAVPAALLAVTFDDLGGLGWTLLMAAFALACVSELYRMLDSWKPVTMVGFVVVAGMCFAAYYGGSAYMVALALASLPLVFVALLLRSETTGATLAICSTLLGVLWIGFAFAHGVLLRDVPEGKGIMIDVMVGTFLADTAAYLGGRWFGRHPLAPTISPKKTWEGLFCGGIMAVLAVLGAGLYQPWLPHGTALILGLAIAVLGPIGDLFESLVKRDAGAKDAGTMFGAHGGALDRLDAVSFTVIVAYYIWVLLPH